MQPFQTLTSAAVVLPRRDIDTDQIIPARFLKGTTREGLGQSLFAGWRYDGQGAPVADFPLNDPRAAGARILVAGANFGCGSSREHAPWALVDHGFRAVISASASRQRRRISERGKVSRVSFRIGSPKVRSPSATSSWIQCVTTIEGRRGARISHR